MVDWVDIFHPLFIGINMNIKIENIKWLKLYRNKCTYNIVNESDTKVLLILFDMFYNEQPNKIKSLLKLNKCNWNFHKMYSTLYSEHELNKVCDINVGKNI